MGDSVIPVGIPYPWPLKIPPIGWLKCNGASFDKTQYPKLTLAYPSGVLPDLRGEFIRGWDDGRGVDFSRDILTWQKASVIAGDVASGYSIASIDDVNGDKSKLGWDNIPSNSSDYLNVKLGIIGGQGLHKTEWRDVYSYVGATRPRNITFNYIVRAA